MTSRDRGVGTLTSVMVMAALVGVTLLGVWALGWLRAHARAADAADLGALAAAQAYAADPESDSWSACVKGAATVKRNQARAENCVFEGDASSFIVTVTAETTLWPRIGLPGAPRVVRVKAVAGSANAS